MGISYHNNHAYVSHYDCTRICMYMDNIIEIVSIQVLSAHMEKQQQKDHFLKDILHILNIIYITLVPHVERTNACATEVTILNG